MIWVILILPLLIWACISLSYRKKSEQKQALQLKEDRDKNHEAALQQARERRWEEVRKGTQ